MTLFVVIILLLLFWLFIGVTFLIGRTELLVPLH